MSLFGEPLPEMITDGSLKLKIIISLSTFEQHFGTKQEKIWQLQAIK